ncbi:MAG: tetratricopeptide repeat protein, partial [Gammaproteobacteria bacterium]|nr:tetratricopeptide repeat protein [Gammaproteobacteria bacterium]
MLTTRQTTYIAIFVALILTVLAYYPGLHGPFAFDDTTNILQNKALVMHSLGWDQLSQAMLSSDAGPLKRPLSMLSFAFNIYFGGLHPLGFKITNLIIHLLCGVLFFILLRQITRYWLDKGILQSPAAVFWLPVLCASAWLLHPLNLTAVLYIVQRETSLCSLFILLGCVVYALARLRQLSGKPGWLLLYIGTAVTGALSVLSKETGLLLPMYLLVIELCVFRFSSASKPWERGLAVFYGLFLWLPFIL